MTSLSLNRKTEELLNAMRPLFLGLPVFLIAALFLIWMIARLASWIIAAQYR